MSEETLEPGERFPSPLTEVGWSRDRQQAWLEKYADDSDAAPARVTRVDRGECDVIGAEGPARVLSDSQRTKTDVAPATGDWVAVTTDPELGPMVAEVLPRRTAMVRRGSGEVVAEQVLVANVDLVGVVHSVDQSFSAARLERLLVVAYDSGATPVVVLTKADLGDAAVVKKEVQKLGVEDVFVTAALQGEGVEQLRDALGSKTLVLIGLSGSGKSTLTNALLEDEVQDTGEVREADSRGRHTTTSRELFVLPGGGVLIDTPGLRAVGLWDAWPAVHRVYADVFELAAHCRFNDCTHGTEPGCAVVEAVANGDLDSDRLGRYRALMIELTELDAEIDEKRRRGERGRRRRPRKRG